MTRSPQSSFENRIPFTYMIMSTATVPKNPRAKAISPGGIFVPNSFTNTFIVLNKSADNNAYIRPFLAIAPPIIIFLYIIINPYFYK
jgi:hypothetical protein